jgi:hypothetical protein
MDVALSKKAPKELTTERYVARFNAEKAALAREYCNLFGFWRACALKRCRKGRTCRGDASACLARRVNEVSREMQWRARQQVMRATPAEAGPPERTAREFLPEALV